MRVESYINRLDDQWSVWADWPVYLLYLSIYIIRRGYPQVRNGLNRERSDGKYKNSEIKHEKNLS